MIEDLDRNEFVCAVYGGDSPPPIRPPIQFSYPSDTVFFRNPNFFIGSPNRELVLSRTYPKPEAGVPADQNLFRLSNLIQQQLAITPNTTEKVKGIIKIFLDAIGSLSRLEAMMICGGLEMILNRIPVGTMTWDKFKLHMENFILHIREQAFFMQDPSAYLDVYMPADQDLESEKDIVIFLEKIATYFPPAKDLIARLNQHRIYPECVQPVITIGDEEINHTLAGPTYIFNVLYLPELPPYMPTLMAVLDNFHDLIKEEGPASHLAQKALSQLVPIITKMEQSKTRVETDALLQEMMQICSKFIKEAEHFSSRRMF